MNVNGFPIPIQNPIFTKRKHYKAIMLQVKNLSYRYPGNEKETLKDLSFSIEKRQIFGFLGPSGSGKSTTQKVLYKLLTDFGGEVLFDGKALQTLGREFYERIGVSFELPNLYHKLTAKENLQFFASFYKGPIKNIDRLLEEVGLSADANKRVADYSKGMKMRLNFVRAIIHDPDVLFLDEPTAGLDPVNGNIMKSIIRNLQAAGKTIFLTTHNMFDADQLCDRVALLHQGVIKAADSPAQLKLKYGQKSVKVLMEGATQEQVFPLETLGANVQFQQLLKTGSISTIHSQEASLEEVFIKITGEQLL